MYIHERPQVFYMAVYIIHDLGKVYIYLINNNVYYFGETSQVFYTLPR